MVPLVAVPVDDPVPLVVLWVLPVDELEDVGWIGVVEVVCVPEVEPLVDWPDSVELVVLDVELPLLAVVEEPAAPLDVPSPRSVGATPPGLIGVVVPPVARGLTSTVTVVVVVGVDDALCAPAEVGAVDAGPPARVEARGAGVWVTT